ncbi:MAG TPA: glutathione S-transferase [Alphaproteobacteria bacterium]|nr:glutathione S-transferase [Alphaproteobacteria bacterium]
MKLYDCKPAPNPRRARMFMAEKGIEIPTIQVDLRAGEHLKPAYRAINPQCVVPYLVLDDGAGIGEVVAIWRYLEETHPTPQLLGVDPEDKAIVAMWQHRMELDGFQAVGEAFRNSTPGFKGRALAGPHDYEQIPALAERGKARTLDFFDDIDKRLGESEFIAGPRFTAADIDAFVAIEFARWIKLAVPAACKNVTRWHNAVSARPSASA